MSLLRKLKRTKKRNPSLVVLQTEPSDYLEPTMTRPHSVSEGTYTGDRYTGLQFPQRQNDGGYDNFNQFDLTGRRLKEIPKEVRDKGQTTDILIIDQNQFETLPLVVCDMTNLTYLSAAAQLHSEGSDLSLPALSNIPRNIGQLQNLRSLVLYNNAIETLPQEVGMLQKLKHLDLRLNQIAEFPRCLFEIPNLQKLYLSGNHMKAMPSAIKHFSSMEFLYVDHNEVRHIPPEISCLKNLKKFSICHNQLEELPHELAELEGLLSTSTSPNMENVGLFVDGNPLLYPPKEHLATTEDIFQYLRNKKPDTEFQETGSIGAVDTGAYDHAAVPPIQNMNCQACATQGVDGETPDSNTVLPPIQNINCQTCATQGVDGETPDSNTATAISTAPHIKNTNYPTPATQRADGDVLGRNTDFCEPEKIGNIGSENVITIQTDTGSNGNTDTLPKGSDDTEIYYDGASPPIGHTTQNCATPTVDDRLSDRNEAQSDEQQKTSTVFDTFLTERRLCTRKQASLFDVLSDQLERPNMNLEKFSSDKLKTELTCYIKQLSTEGCKLHMDEGIASVITSALQQIPSLEEYCNIILHNPNHGDNLTLQLAASFFRRNIHMYLKESFFASPATKSLLPIWTTTYKGGLGKPLHLAFVDSSFQSLGGIEECNSSGVIDISESGYEELPDWVKCQRDVKTLILRKNHFTNHGFWDDLWDHSTLKILDLSQQLPRRHQSDYGPLKTIPSEIHHQLRYLTHLILPNNKINSLPTGVCIMGSLVVLDVIDNNIAEIPQEIHLLKNLEYLGMSYNQLRNVPNTIRELRNLLVLRLSGNKLEDIPESICQLTQLQVLSLKKNRLKLLPLKLFQLTELLSNKVYRNKHLQDTEIPAGLHINENPTLKFPSWKTCIRGQIEPNSEETLKYLRDMQDDKGRFAILRKIQASKRLLTDLIMVEIADKLGRQWRMLGLHLGFTRNELDILQDNYPHDIRTAQQNMMLDWREKNQDKDEDELIQDLKKGFRHSNLSNLQYELDSMCLGDIDP